jgi:hypothetical protein
MKKQTKELLLHTVYELTLSIVLLSAMILSGFFIPNFVLKIVVVCVLFVAYFPLAFLPSIIEKRRLKDTQSNQAEE